MKILALAHQFEFITQLLIVESESMNSAGTI